MKNEIGIITPLMGRGSALRAVRDFGLRVCQVISKNPSAYTPENADRLRRESVELGVRITGFFGGWTPDARDRSRLVPVHFCDSLRRAGDFAKRAGIPAVIVEFRFVPAGRSDPRFPEVARAVGEVARYLGKLGLEFWFETTEEAPVTLLRLMRAIGARNLGINFDPGNLVIYGAGNPLDAIETIGGYIRNVHAKDGLLPTSPVRLGRQVILGKGAIRFPELVRRLDDIGFRGEYIIEREIAGEQQRLDIAESIRYTRAVLAAR